MGLFSSTKKVYVSSVPYNLAGPIEDRLNYLKSTVSQAALMPGRSVSLGERIISAQLKGATMDQRAFFRWARSNYPEGSCAGQLKSRQNVDALVAAEHIPVPVGMSLFLSSAFVDAPDPTYWAEQYLLENAPELFETAWSADYDGVLGQLQIFLEGGGQTNVPLVMDPTKDILVAYYTIFDAETPGSTVQGTLVEGVTSRPSTSGYVLRSRSRTPISVAVTHQTRILVEDLSSEDPASEVIQETPANLPFETLFERYEQVTQVGVSPDQTKMILSRSDRYIWTSYQVVPTVTTEVTTEGSIQTTVERTVYSLAPLYDHRTDTTEIYRENTTDGSRVFIYEMESGTAALDALDDDLGEVVEFFPFIPVRLYNKPISHVDFAAEFPAHKKAFKRATGGAIEDLLASIEDNADVGDIDHAFLVHGVEANTPEKEGRRYIYEFFRELMEIQSKDAVDFANWVSFAADYGAKANALELWAAAQDDPGNPLFGAPKPTFRPGKLPEVNVLRLSSEARPEFDMRLNWLSIDEEIETGLGKPGAQRGDLWFEAGDVIENTVQGIFAGSLKKLSRGFPDVSVVRLYWQDKADAYRVLTVIGMVHQNYVYGGKAVTITLEEALEDLDESGFVVPLHYPTLKKLPAVAANQIAQSNKLLILNCYKVKKVRWYQKGIFKIVFAIVLAVVVALVFPAGVGILGANLAVGASLGFSGVTALIVGAVANAVAAMLLTAVINLGATTLFGDEVGAIIAAVVSFATFQYISNFQMTGSWAMDWGSMMRAENLLQLTDVVSRGVGAWARGEVSNIQDALTRATESYQNSLEEIEKKMAELLGYGAGYIDPLSFTQLMDNSGPMVESSSTFLTRTLLTGSDIAEMSFTMISSFPELSLELPKAIS